jgi:dTMP kinase
LKPGRFITFEGIDGAGKSTQIAWLGRHLESAGLAVKVTREPGGTPFGEQLRGLLLAGKYGLHRETEALLMFAARREHLEQVVIPSLQAGTWVVCDRFTDATYAYQCGGSKMDWNKVAALEKWVHPDIQPDLTLYFEIAPKAGLERSGQVRAPDRFEQENEPFFERVRQAYLRRAREYPHRIRVIDASLSIERVTMQVRACIDAFREGLAGAR